MPRDEQPWEIIRWSPPARPLHLPDDEVHVWRASQDVPPDVRDALALTLSDDERARARRFVVPNVGARFIVAHAFMRDVLGAYLEQPPASLRFDASDLGKPFLVGSDLRFNLSHSGSLAVLAVGRRELGVDIEQITTSVLRERIAERFFSTAEVAMLGALPEHDQPAGFFRCWTRKEAYLKALGHGLRIPLDRFDVNMAADEPPRLLADRGSDRLADWSMASFRPADDFCGAIVALGSDWRLLPLHWSGPL